MPSRFAPALPLDVLVFWLMLRWLLPRPAVMVAGRLLVVMMFVGLLSSLHGGGFVTACFFAASAALAGWLELRFERPRRRPFSLPRALRLRAWRDTSPAAVAALCERRIGLQVDAACPASITADPPRPCVVALAGDGFWVLEDESGPTRARVGRVLACWARRGLVTHVEHSRRGDRLELSWPEHGVLVRAVLPSGAAADLFAGHLVADELALCH